MENYDIGLILRKKREALGYSQNQVCELCHFAFSKQTLHRIETGKTTINGQTIQELLALYHLPSYTACASIELENYSFGRMYNEILVLMFQQNYREAERKLELFEHYIKKDSEISQKYVEALRKELQCFTRETAPGNQETMRFFQNLIKEIVPEEADLEKWPLTDKELNVFLMFSNTLSSEKYNRIIMPLLRSLLKNLEQGYYNTLIFTDYYACFTQQLLYRLRKEKQYQEIEKLANTSLNHCIMNGSISTTYRIYSELLFYYEENNFFEDMDLKEQCMRMTKKMYYFSISCNDERNCNYFERRLIKIYQYPLNAL